MLGTLERSIKKEYTAPSITKATKKNKYEAPKIKKVTKKKKGKKIFCGCWQVANQQDSC